MGFHLHWRWREKWRLCLTCKLVIQILHFHDDAALTKVNQSWDKLGRVVSPLHNVFFDQLAWEQNVLSPYTTVQVKGQNVIYHFFNVVLLAKCNGIHVYINNDSISLFYNVLILFPYCSMPHIFIRQHWHTVLWLSCTDLPSVYIHVLSYLWSSFPSHFYYGRKKLVLK